MRAWMRARTDCNNTFFFYAELHVAGRVARGVVLAQQQRAVRERGGGRHRAPVSQVGVVVRADGRLSRPAVVGSRRSIADW